MPSRAFHVCQTVLYFIVLLWYGVPWRFRVVIDLCRVVFVCAFTPVIVSCYLISFVFFLLCIESSMWRSISITT